MDTNSFYEYLNQEIQHQKQQIIEAKKNRGYYTFLHNHKSYPTSKSRRVRDYGNTKTDLSFNEIMSLEVDSFIYWLGEATIEQLEVFARVDKPWHRMLG